jgi:hypothetical protein
VISKEPVRESSMQVQSSGTCPTAGYSAVQSGGRRPPDGAAASQGGQQDGGVQASGGNVGGNQPVQDPNATRGRIVNITA